MMDKKIILKKGYYVVRVSDLEIIAGLDPRITSQAEALWAWERVREEFDGPDKFFIVWVPFDNFAWGE